MQTSDFLANEFNVHKPKTLHSDNFITTSLQVHYRGFAVLYLAGKSGSILKVHARNTKTNHFR